MAKPVSKQVDCRVFGADKLPAASGGTKTLCAAVETAARKQVPGKPFTVDVSVISQWMLSGKVRLKGGRVLPEQKMAMNDKNFDRIALERFASAVVAQVKAAGGR